MTTPTGWQPYRFEPVLYPGVDFRLTWQHDGGVDAATLYIGDRAYPFTVTGDAAEVVVTWDTVEDVADRTRAFVEVTVGGVTYVFLDGYVTKV